MEEKKNRGPETNTIRAKSSGTNRTYVANAERLLDEAPDLADEVAAGKVTIPQARNRGRDLPAEWTLLAKPVEVKQTRYCDDRCGYLIVRPPRGTPGAMRSEYIDDCLYVLMYGQQGFYTMLGWADRQLLLAAGKLNPVPVRPGQRECWGIHWSRLNAVESLGLLIGGLTI